MSYKGLYYRVFKLKGIPSPVLPRIYNILQDSRGKLGFGTFTVDSMRVKRLCFDLNLHAYQTLESLVSTQE